MTTYLLGARLGKVTQSPACDLEKPHVLSTMGEGVPWLQEVGEECDCSCYWHFAYFAFPSPPRPPNHLLKSLLFLLSEPF